MQIPYQQLIWDWNGTLINDTQCCVGILNEILALHQKPHTTLADYRKTFDFPIISYYEHLGFDFPTDSYEEIADNYIARYRQEQLHCHLHTLAEATLRCCQVHGLGQSILSAYHSDLLQQVVNHFNLTHYFSHLVGLNDYFAASKVDRGKYLLTQLTYPPEAILLIGDTTHDYEVAQVLGIGCLLIGDGHQHIDRLRACGADVRPTIQAVPEYLGLLP